MANHVYGVAFLVVVALLISLSIAAYQRVFTRTTDVVLETDRVGSQLLPGSDVKLRGLIVGRVEDITTTGDGAKLALELDPELAKLVPHDVSARLLPKTLFGERYVDLVTPAAASRGIRDGDVIPQDRSTVAIELERVFADLLPMLRAVDPAKLSTTLNALASTLEGRGTRIGHNLVLVDSYFKQLNPHMPAIQADISGLADLASTYAEAAPELLRAAKALTTTNKTLVEKRDTLRGFLVGTTGFANTTAGFLEKNQNRLIQLGRVQRPTLEMLAKYSPQYPCVMREMVGWVPRMDDAWSTGSFHITLEVTKNQPGYVPGEEPEWGENRRATCGLLADPSLYGGQEIPVPQKKFADGSNNVGGYSTDPCYRGQCSQYYSAQPSVFAPDAGLAGTAQEQQMVAAALGDTSGPSAITTLLAGPMLRGTMVHQR